MSDNDIKIYQEPSKTSKILELAAYPIAIGAGAFTFVSSVNDKLYDTLKGLDELGDGLNKNKENFKAETATIRSKVAEKLSAFHRQNTDVYNNKLKELGFTSFSKRLGGIHRDQRVDSALIGLTFATLTLGAILTIANSKSLMNKINAKEKEQDAQAAR